MLGTANPRALHALGAWAALVLLALAPSAAAANFGIETPGTPLDPSAKVLRLAGGIGLNENGLNAAAADPVRDRAYFASTFAGSETNLVVVDLQEERRVDGVLVDGIGSVRFLVVDPDGDHIFLVQGPAISGSARITRVDLETLGPAGTLTGPTPSQSFQDAFPDPDGEHFLVLYSGSTGNPGGVLRVSYSPLAVVGQRPLPGGAGAPRAGAVVGSKAYIATADAIPSVRVLDLATFDWEGPPFELGETFSSPTRMLADGTNLVIGFGSSPARLARVATAPSLSLAHSSSFPAGANVIQTLAPAPGGGFWATTEGSGSTLFLAAASNLSVSSVATANWVSSLRQSVDLGGGRLYARNTTPGDVAFVDGPAGSPSLAKLAPTAGQEAELRSAALSPDGAHLLVGAADGRAQVIRFDAATMRRIDAIDLPEGDNVTAAFTGHAGPYCHFVVDTNPARIFTVDTDSFTVLEGTGHPLVLQAGEHSVGNAVLHPGGHTVFLSAFTNPGRIVRVSLASPAPVRVSSAQLTGSGTRDADHGAFLPDARHIVYASRRPGDNQPFAVKFDTQAMAEADWIELPGTGPVVAASYLAATSRYYASGNNIMRVVDPIASPMAASSVSTGFSASFPMFTDLQQRHLFSTRSTGQPFHRIERLETSAFAVEGFANLASGESNLRAIARPRMGSDFAFVSAQSGSGVPGRVAKVAPTHRGLLIGTAAVLSGTSERVVDDFRIYSHQAEGQFKIALYDNGTPRQLLWESQVMENLWEDDWAVVPVGLGTPQSLTLQPGTYWLCFQVDTSDDVASYAGAGGGFAIAAPFNAVPPSIDAADALSTGRRWALHATTSPPPPPPPPAITTLVLSDRDQANDPLPGYTNELAVSLLIAAESTPDSFEVSNTADFAAFTTYPGTVPPIGFEFQLAAGPDGPRTVYARTRTIAGTGPVETALIEVDTTPPTADLAAAPVYTNQTTPGLAGSVSDNTGVQRVFASVDGTEVEASLSGDALSWTAPPDSFGPFVDGPYDASVRAVDFAGNEAILDFPGGVVVDTVPPSIGITAPRYAVGSEITLFAGPPPPRTGGAPIVDVGIWARRRSEGWQQVGMLEGPGAFAFLPETIVPFGNTQGMYFFAATAKDAAGNEQGLPAEGEEAFTAYTPTPNAPFELAISTSGLHIMVFTEEAALEIDVAEGFTGPPLFLVGRRAAPLPSEIPAALDGLLLLDERIAVRPQIAVRRDFDAPGGSFSAELLWAFPESSANAIGGGDATAYRFLSEAGPPIEYSATREGNAFRFGPIDGFSDFYIGEEPARVRDWSDLLR